MTAFALIGAGGYIAPRHMQAIRDTGNTLVAAIDRTDSVGILDSYFPQTHFFTEFERFDRHIDKLSRSSAEDAVRYVSICSPNYLHDSHIRFALRANADAICEKPLVLNPWNLDALLSIEEQTGRKVNSILQLRVHPAITALKAEIEAAMVQGRKHEVDLTYITSRGRWYHQSWKGDEKKSGGIATNIGVHFFDLLHFLFGALQENHVHVRTDTRAAGYLEYEHARVRWFMSLESTDIPPALQATGTRTFRAISVDGREVEFSGGFTDLHTTSYENILAGNGFGVEENRSAIAAVTTIRNSILTPTRGDVHPMAEAHR